MNLHVFCKYLSVMLLLQCALSKMLPAIEGLNSELEQVKSEDKAKEQEIQSKKGDMEGYTRGKRALEDSLNKRKQCAVMYKNEEPVGILQSYQGSYRLLPIHIEESIPVDISPIQKADSEEIDKRDTETQAADFSERNYPYIFAKFKIDTKVESQKAAKNLQKRELKHTKKKPALLNSKHMNSLSSTLLKMQANEVGAESELRTVLHDMGLIEDSHIDDQQNEHIDEKRKADLELNENSHTDEQNFNKPIAESSQHGEEKRDNAQADNTDESHHAEEKRDNYQADNSDQSNHAKEKCEDAQANSKLNTDQQLDKSNHAEAAMTNEKSKDDSHSEEKRDLNIVEDEDLELGTNKINLIRMEDSVNDRLKRENEVTRHYDAIAFPEPKSKKQELFANGECDEKESEVASNDRENKVENENKQMAEESEKLLFDDKSSEIEKPIEVDVGSNGREKRSEDVQKQMEQQIKQRLQKIKAEVKNEIEQLKKNSDDNEEFADNVNEHKKEKEKAQRKKRNALKDVSSLEDQETTDLDPVLFGDNNMVPHIRTRRRKRRSLDMDRQYAQFEKTINEETFKKNVAPLVEEKIIDASLMAKNKENPANLVIDLNSHDNFKADKKTNNKKRQDFDPRSTTTNSYLSRSLKEYRTDFNSNPEFQTYDLNNEEDLEPSREKRANQEQPNSPQHLTNVDGSNIVYFDGAPVLADSPSSEDKSKASMQILPSNGNGKIKTNILLGLRDGGYMLDLDPDIYRLTNAQEPREKRQASFIDLVAIHGGGPVLNHLLAIRKRSMLPIARVKRSDNANNNYKMLSLKDMSDVDLFGDLPQSYEGELARYKRVKREK
ncbi:unnamed protein product [Ceutorhynchus assimilis]|uniref:Uncharacterized protein n=1 Tax=Ceutorhynchus assimilis TaxID=467358 RepID=A0A9N9QCN8_9CUCU|nr:unnamed protein product [Ceutorhynchus assimilis]